MAMGLCLLVMDKLILGNWVDGLMEGKGTYQDLSGNSYEGQWKNNNYHGIGIFKYSNGDVYDGEWINGLRSGEGTLSKINGDIYKGGWSANKKEGIGTYSTEGVRKVYWFMGQRPTKWKWNANLLKWK